MKPAWECYGVSCYQGHTLELMRQMPANSVQCCITSPPYWGLRDYGIEPSIWGGDPNCEHEWGDQVPGSNRGGSGTPTGKNGRGENYGRDAARGQFCQKCVAWCGCLGLEPTPDLFIEHCVEVFREVRRIIRPDGIIWLNIGDSYATGAGKVGNSPGGAQGEAWKARGAMTSPNRMPIDGLKPKDLCMIPARLALALQADGWYLRAKLPWLKRNSMPDSATDRPGSTSVEEIFLLAKSERYFYDRIAVMKKAVGCSGGASFGAQTKTTEDENVQSRKLESKEARAQYDSMRNFRNADLFFESLNEPFGMIHDADGNPLAIDCPTQSYHEAHFATFPEGLVKSLILAGTSEKGCCPDCGAPWERVTERIPNPSKEFNVGDDMTGGISRTGNPQTSKGLHRNNGNAQGATPETTGWLDGCECFNDPIPCTVFDPFFGSGTVGRVSRALGQKCIGLEIGSDYVQMAKRRVCKPMGETTGKTLESIEGQKSLF